MTLRYSTDIVIFGGGIAGLWLLNRLQNEGYRPVLLETGKLGGGQTFASQGIVHGGLKYALSGSLTGAANVIASMPERWRQCLSGNGDVDLTGVSILSDHYFMWSDGSLRSKLKSFLGSKSLVGRVQTLEQQHYPEFFKNSAIEGTLYELPDFVIDSTSLVKKLRDNFSSSIFSLSEESYRFTQNAEKSTYSLQLTGNDQEIELEAERFIFAAGEGNRKLIADTNMQSVTTQLRPLHMVYLRSPQLPNVFVHCVGDNFSLTPKLTITSHMDQQGQTIWYLGGELAEEGVSRNQSDQIKAAEQLLHELFPELDISSAEWNSFLVNRAEPDTNSNYRPDDAFLASETNLLAAWPTKFTLTPSLADKVVNTLRDDSVTAETNNDAKDALVELLAEAELAQAYWD
jgi:glycerol-3-phosphate dehydrogenase